jgi:hypothetical protein
VRLQNPKSEAPKSEGNPKPEIRSRHPVSHSARSLHDTEAAVASVLSEAPTPESFAILAFGFRISFGFRPSAFGFQGCGVTLSPATVTLEQPCPNVQAAANHLTWVEANGEYPHD